MIINNKKMKFERYSSKELKLKNSYLQSFIINNQVDIIYNNEISLFELLIVLDYYKSLNVVINLTLCYLPYQRMDHSNTNNVETIKNISNIFNSFNLNNLYICEPHCELNYFKNATKINIIEKLFDKVINEIDFNTQKDCVIFTDKGSVKKFSHLCKNYAYGEKTRNDSTGLINSYKLIGQISANQKILIVDDIISSGDTICEILKTLKDCNNEIYLLCAHLENNKFNKRLDHSDKIKKIFASNSLTKKSTQKRKLFNIKEIMYEQTRSYQHYKLDKKLF